MRLRIASYTLALGIALGIAIGSLFVFSPDATKVREIAAACAVLLAIGLVEQLRHLP